MILSWPTEENANMIFVKFEWKCTEESRGGCRNFLYGG
jgi:hypothetical protein